MHRIYKRIFLLSLKNRTENLCGAIFLQRFYFLDWLHDFHSKGFTLQFNAQGGCYVHCTHLRWWSNEKFRFCSFPVLLTFLCFSSHSRMAMLYGWKEHDINIWTRIVCKCLHLSKCPRIAMKRTFNEHLMGIFQRTLKLFIGKTIECEKISTVGKTFLWMLQIFAFLQ